MADAPVIVATWRFGATACSAGWPLLATGGPALDAVAAAAAVVEDDPGVATVGYGASPNADGVVELDAAIMTGPGHDAGAVAGVTGIRRVTQLARRVMEHSPHVMLVGDNARRFALREGFAEEDLLTDAARARFAAWQTQQTQPDGHDTIGVCALDARGDLAAACSTSGLAWKAPGRVGDSPIIGSGLYVDNEVGAAVATGNGDEIIRVCLASRVVIEMEWGASPQEACEEAVRYLLRKRPGHQERGAACLALGRDGRVGGAATHTGFSPPARVWEYALATADGEPRILEGVYVR